MDKKLVGWSHLQGTGQQLRVLMATSDKWCPSRVHTGTSVTILFINDMDEGDRVHPQQSR